MRATYCFKRLPCNRTRGKAAVVLVISDWMFSVTLLCGVLKIANLGTKHQIF